MDASHPFFTIAEPLQGACQSAGGELKVATVLAHLIDPDASFKQLNSELSDFYADLPNCTQSADLLEWFRAHGFGEAKAFQATSDHSNIAWVVKAKQGLPIVLAILIIGAARLRGLDAVGVNYPGHFLVQLEGVMVNPLTMARIEEEQIESDAQGLHANAASIALRMINNLKAMALARANYPRALDLVDLQLHITADPDAQATLFFERGELWQNFGSISAAIQAFEQARQLTAGALGLEIEKRLAALRRRSEVRH